MSYGYIYKTTSLIDGRIYIGQRKGEFDQNYKGSGLHIKRAFKKFGKYSFKLEVVCWLPTPEQLDEFEKFLIAKYREIIGRENLFNIFDGGVEGRVDGQPFRLRANVSEEARRKMSEARKGVSPWNKGKTGVYTSEAKTKMSLAKKGSQTWIGKKHSEESRRKMSVSAKNRKVDLHGS